MVSYDNTIDLKETEYNYFYSMQYNYHLDDIQYALDYMDDVDDSKTSMTIVDHEIVGLLIYKVTYDDGSYLYLNYNDYTVTVELDDTTSISIESFGYRWE